MTIDHRADAPLLGRAVLLALAGAGAACADAPSADSERAPRSGTAAMAARLAELAANDDPDRNPYAGRARLDALRAGPPPANPIAALQRVTAMSEIRLGMGQLDSAIAGFEGVRTRIAELGVDPPEEVMHSIAEQVAIAHVRLYMRAACVDARNPGACSLPARVPAGVSRAPLETAIAEYLRILERHPDDLRSRWLVNAAAMLAGRPAEIPDRWRIPASAFESEHDIGVFPDIAGSLGVDVAGHAGGAAVDDFDGDGDLDIVVSSRGLGDPLRYFENTGDGGFRDATETAGLTGITGGVNLVQADYDNDGNLDVLVLRGGWLAAGRPNSLLRNLGGGRFADVTEAAGVWDEAPTQTAAWADYDGDGDLDLFVGNETARYGRFPCRLFRNEGDGTFVDVAPETGAAVEGFVKAAVWGDYDNDGRPDLFLSRLRESNTLLRNEGPAGGGWSFRDVSEEAGITGPLEGFPAWFFDYDNDGWLDVFVSGYRPEPEAVAVELLGLERETVVQHLHRNLGDGTFREVAAEVGLDRVAYAMGANFEDLDEDGWLDLYLGTGAPDFRHLVPNRMFRNAEGRRFQDVTSSGGFGHLGKGHAVSFADVDNDGDQDVYAVIGGAYEGDIARNVLFENPGHGRRWITLRLVGVEANRSAIGARIEVAVETPAGTRSIHRVVGSGGSFGASSLQQEIGLGGASRIARLEIAWPGSGRVDVHEDVQLDRIFEIREGEAPVALDVPVIPLRRGPS